MEWSFFIYVHEHPELVNVSAVGGGYYSMNLEYDNKLQNTTCRIDELEKSEELFQQASCQVSLLGGYRLWEALH